GNMDRHGCLSYLQPARLPGVRRAPNQNRVYGTVAFSLNPYNSVVSHLEMMSGEPLGSPHGGPEGPHYAQVKALVIWSPHWSRRLQECRTSIRNPSPSGRR